MSKFKNLFFSFSILAFIFGFGFFLNSAATSHIPHAYALISGGGSPIGPPPLSGDEPCTPPTPSSGQYLGGYGWSSTIGWISFSGFTQIYNTGGPCPGYEVDIDSSGNLSGYAWSSNLGWLKFGSDLSSFPVANGNSQNNGKFGGTDFNGWGRFCAGMYDQNLNQTTPNNTCAGSPRTDGWDGWFSLKGNNHSISVTGNDGPVANSKKLAGFAWGSDVVGWVDMSGVYITGSGVTNGVNTNVSAQISSAVGVCPAEVKIDWTVTSPNPFPASTRFNIYKNNALFVSGLDYNNSSHRPYYDRTIPATGGSFTYKIEADDNGVKTFSSNSATVNISPCTPPIVQQQAPTIGNFKAVPSAVEAGGSCQLTWADILNIDASISGNVCRITGPGISGSDPNYAFPPMSSISAPGSALSGGSVPTPPISASSRYTLTCTNPAGQAQKQTMCNLKPKFNEF